MIKIEIKQFDLDLLKKAMNSEKPTLVKFYNPNCYLCNGLKPVLTELQNQYDDNFDFAKVNVLKYPKIAKVFKINGVPELFVIKKDFVQQIPYPSDDDADPVSGYPKEYLISHLDNLIQTLMFTNQGC